MSYATVELAVDLNAKARELEARLDRAERRDDEKAARKYREQLAFLRHSIDRLVERN